MKKFMVFTGSDYYPSGGMKDFRADFDTLDEALKFLVKDPESRDWFQIYNTETREIVDL